jgi:predicted  nucleic acid-binding Zn-ribbon protein
MLGISSCPKCGNGRFKLVTQEPSGSNFKLNFIQCSSCNSPVGVMDYFNTGAQMEDQKKQIDKISSRLSSIEHTLQQLVHALQRR